MPRKKLSDEQRFTVSRLNALKHGFAARSPVLPGIEDEADWKRHLRGMQKSLAPDGYYEEFLVRRLASTFWEIDRLTSYQVAATMDNIRARVQAMGISQAYLSGGKEVDLDPYEIQERVHSTLLPSGDNLEVVMRYGAQLHRQWIQTYNQLLNVQAMRRGEAVNRATVDVIGAPQTLGPYRSSSGPAKDLAKAVNTRVDQAEHAAATRPSSDVPTYLAKAGDT